jgi:hypothetical protein
MNTDIRENEKQKNQDAGEDNGVRWRAIAGVETGEPDGNKVVPAGGHGEAGDAGKDKAGGGDETKLHEQDCGHGKQIGEAGVAEGVAQGLWDRRDVVDVSAGEGEDRAGAGDEHGADDGRGEDDRLADGTGSVPAFSGEDRDVFKAAQSAEEHLAEEGNGDHVSLWKLERKRLVVDGLVVS